MSRYDGKLVKWDDDGGFGFIGTRDGGHEIFVHVSAFPRPGPRPQLGEMLSFEVEAKKDGRKHAVRIHRVGRVPPPRRQGPVEPRSDGLRRLWNGVIAVLLVVGIGTYAFKEFSRRPVPSPETEPVERPRAAARPLPPAFSCDGRTYCSQMKSCEEATYFLRNCPGTQMDGNNDGIPCESQWCTSPFAR